MKKEELALYIANAAPGTIIVLDAPSGYGKTRILNEAKDIIGDGAVIVSYETMVNDIVRYIYHSDSTRDITDELPPLVKRCRLFAIEDIDFLAGRNATQECIAAIVNKIAQYRTTVVVITGINITQKMPLFVNSLKNVIYIKES